MPLNLRFPNHKIGCPIARGFVFYNGVVKSYSKPELKHNTGQV